MSPTHKKDAKNPRVQRGHGVIFKAPVNYAPLRSSAYATRFHQVPGDIATISFFDADWCEHISHRPQLIHYVPVRIAERLTTPEVIQFIRKIGLRPVVIQEYWTFIMNCTKVGSYDTLICLGSMARCGKLIVVASARKQDGRTSLFLEDSDGVWSPGSCFLCVLEMN